MTSHIYTYTHTDTHKQTQRENLYFGLFAFACCHSYISAHHQNINGFLYMVGSGCVCVCFCVCYAIKQHFISLQMLVSMETLSIQKNNSLQTFCACLVCHTQTHIHTHIYADTQYLDSAWQTLTQDGICRRLGNRKHLKNFQIT